MGGKTGTAAPAAEEKGPDNNKRLAFLEAGVSSLAIALAANGVAIGEGEDPLELAIGQIKGSAAAIARAETAENALEAVRAELVAAEKDLEALRASILDLEEKLAAAQSGEPIEEPAPVRERPEHARDFGPTFGRATTEELEELIGDGEGLEISFSNGEFEMVELAPVTIGKADLRAHSGRLALEPPIFVRGGELDDEIHGAVLVKDGVQIDYCEFPSKLALAAKTERRFERAITFG